MMDLKNIGNVLGGLGAGLTGQGPQFQRNQAYNRQLEGEQAQNAEDRRKQAALEQMERQKTVFTDSFAALKLLDSGRADLAQQLLGNRLELSKGIQGVDFEQTEQLATLSTMLASGDEKAGDLLRKTLTNNVAIGKALEIPGMEDEEGKIVSGGNIDKQGQVAFQNPDGTISMRQAAGFKPSGESEFNRSSAMTRIYDNGTNIQVRSNGDSIVRAPGGNVVEGDERRAVLQTARQEQVNQKVAIAGETEAAKVSIAASDKYFARLDAIRPLISNIDRAIAAIDDGAKSGVFISMMPSFRDASKQLDNIQKRLGLDVVSNTTFGALSAGELSLAIDTALPTNMDPPELREWLVEKKNAQVKLSNYVEDAAIFLGTPGNTIARWIEYQKSQRQEGRAQPAAGQVKFLGFE